MTSVTWKEINIAWVYRKCKASNPKTIEMTEGLAAWTLPPNLSVLLEHHLQHCGPEYLTDDSVSKNMNDCLPYLRKVWQSISPHLICPVLRTYCQHRSMSVSCPVASKLNKEIIQCSSCSLKENEGASRSRPISLSQKHFVEKNHH